MLPVMSTDRTLPSPHTNANAKEPGFERLNRTRKVPVGWPINSRSDSSPDKKP